ncbi:tetratricopeptide repeat protein [Pseudemcibacter sp.]|uniref:tetratricopeptide repeat protein n=1 Tax=Pseudemcibacter sp. TaxID=2943293 RepID=UPI002313E167|nr:hypothetical protein [Emcibacteraceae bacterium]
MKLNIKNTFTSIAIIAGISLSTTSAFAQSAIEPWTGAIPGDTIYFSNNDGLKQVRKMLNDGKIEKAVTFAEAYVKSADANSRSGKTSSMRYDAYNALCLSLTADKQFVKAISACDEAIEHSPKRWQAYNSRGSLNYKYGKYSNALNDYKIALENAPNQSGIRKIIEHNIKLSQSRVSNN